MTKLITVFFLISSTQVLFADTLSDSDKLFDWAEVQYPEFFSQPNQESQSLGDYYYRYYPGTNNYLGVNIVELDVHVLGDVFGGLVRIDSLSSLMVTAQLADTIAPVISLNGESTLTISQGDSYTELGTVVTDNVDANIAATVTGTVDSNTPGIYTLSYSAKDNAGNEAVSVTRTVTVAAALSSIKLNDTGITFSGNYPSGNNTSCIGTEVDKQDCSYGRDAQASAGTLTKTGAGAAGFDFTKLDNNGNSLPASATSWSCVKDNHTGLIWEVKTTAGSGGIHDANNTYRWGGKTAQGTGFGTYYSDWDTLVDGSNSESLCGFTDWRVPNRYELRSIVNLGVSNPAIDTDYFPNTPSAWVWSSSPDAYDSYFAWSINFSYGNTDYYNRVNVVRVRLVRSGQ